MKPRRLAPLVALLGSLSLLLLAVPSTWAQTVNEGDRAALKALYAATNGTYWSADKTAGWANIDTATDLGDLYGVTVDSDGRVIRLELNHTFPGPEEHGGLPQNWIPSTIGNLTSLTHLRLTANALTGRIPSTIGRLTNLTELEIAANDLTGSIPPLSALTNLVKLNLGNNQLTGGIPNISTLTNLTHLGLNNNKLTGRIPPSINNLTSLVEIALSENQLSGPIPDLSALISLTHLYLRVNQLTGAIPTKPDPNDATKQIPALPTSLTTLFLSENRLRGPIPNFSGFGSLTTDGSGLFLHENELGLDASGQKIPMQDLNAIFPSAFTLISLRDNKLNGPLPDFSTRTGLTILSLRNNNIGTKVDGTKTDISGLASKLPTGLTHLYLSNNGLQGPIPTSAPSAP